MIFGGICIAICLFVIIRSVMRKQTEGEDHDALLERNLEELERNAPRPPPRPDPGEPRA